MPETTRSSEKTATDYHTIRPHTDVHSPGGSQLPGKATDTERLQPWPTHVNNMPGPGGPAADLQPSDLVLSGGQGYQKLERLGRGEFGEVWRASAPGGVEVAVKIILRTLDHEASRAN